VRKELTWICQKYQQGSIRPYVRENSEKTGEMGTNISYRTKPSEKTQLKVEVRGSAI
jgi:hypothetical protein